MDELMKNIVDYIIKTTQTESKESGFQYIVSYADIQSKFSQEIERYIYNEITEILSCREEVADVIQEVDGFDVVLHTNYAPNYDPKDYERND